MSTQTVRGWVPDDTLANRLVLIRRTLGLTQRMAAELCGLTFGEWQSLEDGRAARGIDQKVNRICAAVGVDRDWLMWGGPLGGGGLPRVDSNHQPAGYGKYQTFSGIASGLATAAA